MSVTFKAFTSLVAEGKQAYSSYSSWADAAESAGLKVKKLSGERRESNQTWAAFNDKDEKVGEFAEQEQSRGGWLAESQLTEIFGVFRNNNKLDQLKALRLKQKAEKEEKEENYKRTMDERRKKREEAQKEKEEREDAEKKRSGSTNGTRKTKPSAAASGRASERDWVKNLKDDD